MEIKADFFGSEYITQKYITDESLRFFVTALVGENIDTSLWRGASAQEFSEWQNMYNNNTEEDASE